MMRRWIVCCVTMMLWIGLTTPAFAQQGRRNPGSFGIGVGSGTFASGLSLKSFGGGYALQGTIGTWRGFGWGHPWGGRVDAIAASGDILINQPALSTSEFLTVAWNMGGGAGLGIREDGVLGVAGAFVLGLEVNFHVVPVDLVFEYRPSIRILPGLGFAPIDFTGHLRFYLN